jgi:uncharacterized lipoprotein NlpE involved in copper resistance
VSRVSRAIAVAAWIALALTGCGRASTQSSVGGARAAGSTAAARDTGRATTVAQADTARERMVSVYEGTLPCADCAGLKTVLTLFAKPGWAEGTYKLRETYLATRDGDKMFEASGQWTTLKGDATDDNATVYQLNPDDSTKARNFLRVSHNEIRTLDREFREIQSPMNLSLKRTAGEGE